MRGRTVTSGHPLFFRQRSSHKPQRGRKLVDFRLHFLELHRIRQLIIFSPQADNFTVRQHSDQLAALTHDRTGEDGGKY